MITLLSTTFAPLPDSRRDERVASSLHDTLMSGFAMMFFQHASLLELQRKMPQRRSRCNLETIVGGRHGPSDTQMRDILDGVPRELLRPLLPTLFARRRRAGWAKAGTSTIPSGADRGAYYTLMLDRTDYFNSIQMQYSGYLYRKYRKGQEHFRHTVVAATLVKAGSHRGVPFDVEEGRHADGQDKQDCAINAARRLIPRVRQAHPQLPLIIGGDDLYCHEPFVLALREHRMPSVLGCKPGSHPAVYQEVAAHEA
jgi:hypothetical protein